jgi:hypothetical protein
MAGDLCLNATHASLDPETILRYHTQVVSACAVIITYRQYTIYFERLGPKLVWKRLVE